MTRESADLKQATESLRTVIREMEQKIDKVFHEAFKEIRQKFETYFRIIFGGGKAEPGNRQSNSRQTGGGIEPKSDEDDTEDEENGGSDEIGIEIFACPPGKKITNLSMLSGGERSLTSLGALLRDHLAQSAAVCGTR